jgi:hypothetical protein
MQIPIPDLCGYFKDGWCSYHQKNCCDVDINECISLKEVEEWVN